MRRKMLLTVALTGCLLTLSVVPFAGDVKAQTESTDPLPVSLAIVYDTSSLTDKRGRNKSFRKKELFAALADYVRRANPRAEFFVIRFDTTYRLTLGGTTDKEATLKELSKLASSTQEGATSFFDACLFAINTVARGRHERRAILLMSNGMDTISEHVLEDVVDTLAKEKITVYAVNIDPPDANASQFEINGNYALGRLASVSNGRLFQLKKDKADITFFQTIANELNHPLPERSQ